MNGIQPLLVVGLLIIGFFAIPLVPVLLWSFLGRRRQAGVWTSVVEAQGGQLLPNAGLHTRHSAVVPALSSTIYLECTNRPASDGSLSPGVCDGTFVTQLHAEIPWPRVPVKFSLTHKRFFALHVVDFSRESAPFGHPQFQQSYNFWVGENPQLAINLFTPEACAAIMGAGNVAVRCGGSMLTLDFHGKGPMRDPARLTAALNVMHILLHNVSMLQARSQSSPISGQGGSWSSPHWVDQRPGAWS